MRYKSSADFLKIQSWFPTEISGIFGWEYFFSDSPRWDLSKTVENGKIWQCHQKKSWRSNRVTLKSVTPLEWITTFVVLRLFIMTQLSYRGRVNRYLIYLWWELSEMFWFDHYRTWKWFSEENENTCDVMKTSCPIAERLNQTNLITQMKCGLSSTIHSE